MCCFIMRDTQSLGFQETPAEKQVRKILREKINHTHDGSRSRVMHL